MGKNYFTPEQVEELRKNKYVKHVSEKAITYTEEFKEIFVLEYQKGKLPSQILMDLYRNNIFYRYDNETFKSCDGKKLFHLFKLLITI